MSNAIKMTAVGIAGSMLLALAVLLPQLSDAQTPNTVRVTIAKFIDGSMATSGAVSNASFPMTANWNATNMGSGSGSFSLGPTGFNTATPYQAVTAEMSSGANYSVTETTGTSTTSVGASCGPGQTYQLSGYSTGPTLAQAQSATMTTSAPQLTNITSDRYIIVWNRHCVGVPTLLSPGNGSSTTTAGLTGVDWTDVTSPVGGIRYIFQSSLSANTNADGAFSNPAYTSGQLTGSFAATPNTPPGTYYWHVRAVDAHGNMSAWSPVWSFTVTQGTTTLSEVRVHILKYLNGSAATAQSASSFQFPMSATWRSGNLNGGATTTGTFVLGNSHGGASQTYGAQTSLMQSPAYYTLSETTGTATTSVLAPGAACAAGRYQLVGYTVSPTSFQDAATKTPTTTAPVFSSLAGNQYVIVWNKTCTDTATSTTSLTVTKYAVGGNATFNFTANHGAGNFTITTSGNTGSHTLSNLDTSKRYNVNETRRSGWREIFNSCRNVIISQNATANCVVINVRSGFIPWWWFR